VALVVGRVLLAGGDREVALPVLPDVVGRVGVVLLLVVAPAAATDVELPLAGVDGAAGRAVEFVLPGDAADGGVGAVVAGGGCQAAALSG